MIFNKRDMDTKQRFGIRKLSVGVCSVLLSTLFLTFTDNNIVKATTEDSNGEPQASVVESSGTEQQVPQKQIATQNNGSENTMQEGSEKNSEASSLLCIENDKNNAKASITTDSQNKVKTTVVSKKQTQKEGQPVPVKPHADEEETVDKTSDDKKQSAVKQPTSDEEKQTEVETTTLKLDKVSASKFDAKMLAESKVTENLTPEPIGPATNAGTASFEITQQVASNVQLYGGEKSTYNGKPVSFNPTNTEEKKNFGFHNVEGLTIPNLTSADFEWIDGEGNSIDAPTNVGTYYLQLNKAGQDAFADANKNYGFVDKNGKSTITGRITYNIDPAELVVGITGSADKVFDNQDAKITQEQIDNGDIKLVWGDSNTEPTGLGKFTLTPDDHEVVTADGKPALHANAGKDDNGQVIKGTPYEVRLTPAALEKIKKLTGANNYAISQSTKSGEYFIYAHKAKMTLSGNQTTTYGIYLPFDKTAYQLELTNWVGAAPAPKFRFNSNGEFLNNGVPTGIMWRDGYLYVKGFGPSGLPTNVGSYKVKIAQSLIDAFQKRYPDYHFESTAEVSAESDNGVQRDGTNSYDQNIVEAKHNRASYVIQPAETTVTINNAQHVRYGESTAIKYGDGGYTLTITAPQKPESVTTVDEKAPIYQNQVTLSTGDLKFVTTPGNVGKYEVKLSKQGLKKLADLTGSSNYYWTQAASARANFFVDQMPVNITVGGTDEVTYGSSEWQNVIKNNLSGYTLTVKTDAGSTLTYEAKVGDLVFNQTPGNVGTYNVELSADGLKNIANALGTNYAYPQAAIDVKSHGTLTVNPSKVTVTLTGNTDGKTYDAKQTLASGLDLSKYSIGQVIVYSADGTKQTVSLNAGDLQIVGNATDVGSYDVKLSDAGKDRIKNLTGNNGDNYTWTFNSTAKYTISAATAKANLDGFNEKVYDGTPVTTAQVNSNGQILVHFTYPGSTEQSTYQLQDDDYTWNTGAAPTNVGTYTITLNKANILQHLQTEINKQAGVGQDNKSNVTISADDLSGQATFTIKAQPISNVVISGNEQSKTYNGDAASLDVNGLTISADGTISDKPLVDTGITVSDFDWYDADGNLLKDANGHNYAPVNVGDYEARLKSSALETLQNANKNYSFDAANATIKYKIKPATATATLGKEGSRDYDAKTTSVADVLSKLGWTDSGFVKNQTLKLTDLTASDYAWFTKNADGTFTAMTGDPINAGTYYLKLKDSLEAKLKAENPNYNLMINGEFTYTINPVSGTATLSGSASKIYDGKDISLDDLNSPDGDIEVKFTFPGSTVADTYKLHAGDYTIENNSAKADDYTISLSTDGLARLQAAIDNYAGAGNVTLAAKDLSSNASFTIKQKDLTVTLDKKPNTTPGKTYDGQTATIDDNDAQFTAAGLVEGQTLNVANLTPSDYEWVDKDGKKLDKVPTDAGTYYIALTQAGVNQLQKDNPNYKVSESGQFAYVIAKAEAKVEINGSYEGTSTEINPDDFPPTLTLGNNPGTKVNGLTSSDYQFVDDQSNPISVPTESGHYHVALTPQIIQKLQKDNPNYKIPGSNIAPFTLDATLTIVFQDTDENNKQVGDAITKIGVDGSTIDNLGLNIPAGYELAKDETLPSDYTFGKDLKQSVFVKLAHIKKTVEHTDPIPEDSKTPTGKPINGAHENDLNKTITRTINVTDPSGKKTSTAQDAKIYRNAVVDEVTGKVTYGAWSTGNWGPFTTPTIDGYTPTIASVATKPVTYGTDPESVDITYTPNAQTTNIIYKDEDGQTIKTDKVDGKTDETVDVHSIIPAGWKLVDGQDVPETVKFGPNGHPDIPVVIEHKTITVTPETPEDKIPTGKVPGDPDKTYPSMETLTKTPTRTINVTKPDGTKITKTQTVDFTRTATFDEVTGEVVYSGWTFKESNAKDPAKSQWDAYNAPVVPGYTADKNVVVKDVTDGTDSVTVDITYTPNAQTTNIVYKDKDGQTIKTDKVDGKTNETVKVDSTIPVGWKLLDGHKPAPKTVKFGPEGHPDIVIEIEHNITKVPHDNPVPENGKTPTDKPIDGAHEDDLNQTITRTINVKNPDGTTDTTTQTAKIYRDASYDDVTGEVTYGDWSTATWDAFNTPTIKDYTPSQAEVPAVIVQDGQKDEVVNITYVPVPKPEQGEQVIHYVDGDDGDKVISTQVVKGKDGEDVSFTPNIPNNFVPATDIPSTVKISGSTTTITLKHKTTDASQTKIITRTITENFPSGATKTETQSATLTETGTKDLVTGEIKWHNDWTTGEWQKFTPATVPGYTPSEAEVPAVEVKVGQKDVTITINYSPTEQTGKISYQDKDGNEIGTTPLTGKTDETIPVDPNKDVPAGWKIIPDQKIPETVKVTPDGVPTVVVKIEHKTITVTPETPEEEIPMGKVPGDPSKTYPAMESITKTPTRKITVIKPDGSKLVIEQIVEFTRTATFDEVTGEVIYTDWKLAKSNAQGGKAQWDAYIPQAISGYTMHIEQKVGDKTTAINSIDAAEVTEATGDVTITVTYVAINPGGNGGNSDDTDHTIPEEPIKPDDHKPEVPVKTPNETSDDTEIDTTPKDQDIESGPAVIKGYEENNAPLYEDMNNSAPARNNNSISPKGADTYASTNAPAKATSAETEENSGKHELPQTGEKQNEAGIFGILAMVLGLFGLADRKKKKDE